MPSHAKLHLSTLYFEDLYEQQVNFWHHVKQQYGVDMSPLAQVFLLSLVWDLSNDALKIQQGHREAPNDQGGLH